MSNLFTQLPDATTAAQTIERGKYEKAQQQAARIETLITQAIKSGQRGVSVNDPLETAVKVELESKGYKVKYNSDQRDGSYTTITW